MTYEIQKVLVLSTAHLNPGTAPLLNMQTDDVPVTFAKDAYGWWVLVPGGRYGENGKVTQDPPTCPNELVEALDLAREQGCDWLCFDRDGPVVETLSTWDW